MNRRALIVCAWCGPFLAVCFGIGFVLLAHWIPPPAPNASAHSIASMYQRDTTSIRLGMIFCIVSLTLMTPWGVSIAMQTRDTEAGQPMFTYIQLIAIAIGATVTILFCVVFATAAFRPGSISPDITRTLNDLGWFLFLFTWPPFSVWAAAIGIPILRDRSPTPVFPRWVGYFNLWAALVFGPAGLMAFFKSGPFAWDGLVALYIPFAVFMVWLVVMTVFVIKAANARADSTRLAAAQPAMPLASASHG